MPRSSKIRKTTEAAQKPAKLSYDACFSAQMGALGIAGQRRLRDAVVVIAGVGGLGSSICCTLASAGVGTLVIIDPQRVAPDNFNRYAFARSRDVRRPKVDVVAGFFDGRPHLRVIPIYSRVQNVDLQRDIDGASLLIAACNTLTGRLAVARLGAMIRVPQLAAGVTDSAIALSGTVMTWTPQRPDLACPACFITSRLRIERGESLLATAVAVVGATAASEAVRMLTASDATDVVMAGNVVAIDVRSMSIERLLVTARNDCTLCNRTNVARHVR